MRRRGGRLAATVTLKRFRGRTLTVKIRRGRKTVQTVRYRVCKR